MNNVLLTDRVFLSLSVPLQPEQEKELEESLLQDGCREPIITWNGVIIDGHKRYHFCSAEGIEYSTEEMDFLSTEEAISAGTSTRSGSTGLMPKPSAIMFPVPI